MWASHPSIHPSIHLAFSALLLSLKIFQGRNIIRGMVIVYMIVVREENRLEDVVLQFLVLRKWYVCILIVFDTFKGCKNINFEIFVSFST